MASGTIALTRTGSGYLTGQIVWSSVSNGTEANTSTVTAQLQIQRSALNATTGTFNGTLTIGTVSESISWYGTLSSNTWVTVKTMSAVINHNADGSGSCYLYAKVDGPTGTTMAGTSVSGSATVALDAIAQYATLVHVTNFTDEGNPVIAYSNPAGATVTSLQACISLDGSTAKIGYKNIPKNETSYIFPLTDDERNTLRAATSGNNILGVYVLLKTVIGSSSHISSLRANMNIVNATPVVSVTVEDTNSATVAVTGDSSILVAWQSAAQITIGATAKKYAGIVSKKVVHGTVTLTDSGTISPVTNAPILVTVTDSRGNAATLSVANTVVPYINPTCVIGNEMPGTDGKLALEVTGLFYNGAIGKTTNTLTVQYRYKASGGSYGSWKTFGTVSKSGNGYTATANVTGLDYQTVYTFQARVKDAIHTSGVRSAAKAVISLPVFDWGQNDFRFRVPVTLDAGVSATTLTSADDLDTIRTNGWYGWNASSIPLNAPSRIVDSASDFNYATAMRVWTNTGGACCQEIVDMSDSANHGVVMRRTIYGSTAYDWEWVNPPMKLGIEYRTIERYNGKPVYAKLVNFGALPNNNDSQKYGLQSGVDQPISASMQLSDGTNKYGSEVGGFDYFFVGRYDGNMCIGVKTTADLSSFTAHFLVKYTKL